MHPKLAQSWTSQILKSHILNIPRPKYYTLLISHILNIPNPQHSTSWMSHLWNIQHIDDLTSWTSHIPNISHAKYPTSWTYNISNIPRLKYRISQASYVPSIAYSNVLYPKQPSCRLYFNLSEKFDGLKKTVRGLEFTSPKVRKKEISNKN